MWKITFFFQMLGATWTETFYLPSNTSFSAVQFSALTVGIARIAMCPKQVTWVATRVVSLNLPRAAQFIGTNNAPTQGTFVQTPGTDPDQDAAPSFIAAQVKLFGNSGRVYRRYFAGAPEGVIGTQFTSRNIGALGVWSNALAAYVRTLWGQGMQVRYQNQAGKTVVTAVTTNAQFPNEIGVTFPQQMIAGVQGQTSYLLLRGFRSVNPKLFGLGGVYPIDPASPGLTAAAAPFVYYLQNTSRVSPSNIAKNGYGVQLAYGFDSVSLSGSPDGTGYSLLSFNHRKRGVSALALRGRLRTRP